MSRRCNPNTHGRNEKYIQNTQSIVEYVICFQAKNIAENIFSGISVLSDAYDATSKQHVPFDTFLFLEDE
jgi:hypothetical protein